MKLICVLVKVKNEVGKVINTGYILVHVKYFYPVVKIAPLKLIST